jgi:hypothetical protein
MRTDRHHPRRSHVNRQTNAHKYISNRIHQDTHSRHTRTHTHTRTHLHTHTHAQTHTNLDTNTLNTNLQKHTRNREVIQAGKKMQCAYLSNLFNYGA